MAASPAYATHAIPRVWSQVLNDELPPSSCSEKLYTHGMPSPAGMPAIGCTSRLSTRSVIMLDDNIMESQGQFLRHWCMEVSMLSGLGVTSVVLVEQRKRLDCLEGFPTKNIP